MLTDHLAERLKEVAESAENLAPPAPGKLAVQIAAAPDNALWDAQVRSPDHLAVLRALAEDARRGPKLPMPSPRDTGDEHLLDRL
jgi:hypothetical protein